MWHARNLNRSQAPRLCASVFVASALLLSGCKENPVKVDKLRLDGSFSVDRAEFTKSQVQDQVDAFSTKARGVKDDTPDPVVSNFRGTFKMRDGAIHFSNVTFAMPGARVSVNGRYVMKSEVLDFRGIVRLDAKLSQLTTGVKSFFLRVVDGLFRHDDITVVPITIGGTADKPKVGLDFGKAIKDR